MTSPFNPAIRATFAPPVMEARRWLETLDIPADKPLINVSQAAPVEPPPLPLRQEIARIAIEEPAAHIYGPVLGLPELRDEIAREWSHAYNGEIRPEQVAITSGCNQAFTAAIATLAGAGDAVILPTPWYFNHKMALDMAGIECRPLPVARDMLPDPEQAEALLDSRVKAIVLVTPNNPTGAEYPAETVQAFFDLARRHGIALIMDETYRDFDSRDGAPHHLFEQPDWDRTLIQLYSFSKAYRLTGHRVGALLTSVARMRQVEKYLDTVTICANQIGQRAALFGMRNLGDWRREQRREILDRRAAVERELVRANGWRLLGAGAYFAYLEHPFDMASDELAQRILADTGILMLPGTMFAPTGAEGGSGSAETQMRVAFANVDAQGIGEMFDRLAAFSG